MKTNEMNRREFLARGAVGVAGLAIAGRGAAMGGAMGGGTTVVDPPIGPALATPALAPNASTTPGLVDVSIEARPASVVVNGTPATLLTYAGSFVAPTIRARRGDRILLRFRNGLPQTHETNLLGFERYPTNVHVHGLHVTPGDNPNGRPGDNVHLVVQPGGALTYEYDLSQQRPGSLALYHPHVHGSVAEQMWRGLVGAIDVADDPITALSSVYDPARTRILMLKDLTISNGAPAPYSSMEYMQGKEGSWSLVNGQLNPYLSARPGQVTRFRIINGSNARFYRLSLQGHTMCLVGTDGGLLDRAYGVTELLLAPGERADVLVRASSSKGSYKLLALPYARRGNMASPQTTLMTFQVQNRSVADLDPAKLGTIDPGARRLTGDTSMLPAAQFRLSMMQMRGYVNGVSFKLGADGAVIADEHHSMVGTEELWTIVNDSGMDHPWHQHVNDAQVLSITGGDSTFASYARTLTQVPAWKDTVIVPKWGSVTLRIPIRDFTGMTMYHCHILEHEDIGMMGMWHIMDGGMPM
jgi:FtsP/CotA-like multicopper oxidase with cupredoxin domain